MPSEVMQALPVGRRIVVTGLAGSGKSTLAKALAARTGLPLIHLDLEFWQPGWTAPSDEQWRERQRVVLAGDEWVADGNYHDTLDLRVGLADTVIVMDTPWWRCSLRALRRGLVLPDQLPPGCTYTRWERLRDEWKLAARIRHDRRSEPAREREIIGRAGGHATCHVLRSRREVDAFLAAVPDQRTGAP